MSEEFTASEAHPVVGQFPPPPPGPPPLQSPPATSFQNGKTPSQDHQKVQLSPEWDERKHEQGQQQQDSVPQFPPPPQNAKRQALDEKGLHFAPPPPPQLPLPLRTQRQQQQHTCNKHQHEHKEQQQQQKSAYSIPAYDPANPVFAPPPTQTYHHQESRIDVHDQSGQHHQEQQGPIHHAESSPHDRPKHNWSERFSHLGVKAAAPINHIAHKLGSQSFLPETLDKECDKAAAILKAFCKKGVYSEPGASSNANATPLDAETKGDTINAVTLETSKNRVIVTIPPRVIAKAVGLAIFTTLRAGYGLSGATGSGILVARLPDGSWSPPSGIQLHTVGGGFQIGLDIYDCVCVINSDEALEAFMNTRVSLGSDLAVVAGPYGAGGAVNFGAAVLHQASKKCNVIPPVDQDTPGAESPSASQQQQQKKKKKKKNQNEQIPQFTEDGQVDKKKDGRRGILPSATKPVFSYVKSRGLFAGISIDGTVVSERKDANASFYGQTIGVRQILKGQVPPQGPAGMWPAAIQNLLAVLGGVEAGLQKEQQPHGYSCDGDHDADGAPPPHYIDDGQESVDPDVKYK